MKFNQILIAIACIATLTACKKENNDNASYLINTETSVVEWKGVASDHFHTGAFDVTGNLQTQNGIVSAGNFIIPISSIKNYDLPDPAKTELLNHLKSPDFFNVALHPNAEFKLKTAKALDKADTLTTAGYNYRITGDFSMIGQTHEISFPAKITITQDSLFTTAAFKINRLTWGMTSYNDPTKPLYLLPDVELKLNVKAAVVLKD